MRERKRFGILYTVYLLSIVKIKREIDRKREKKKKEREKKETERVKKSETKKSKIV